MAGCRTSSQAASSGSAPASRPVGLSAFVGGWRRSSPAAPGRTCTGLGRRRRTARFPSRSSTLAALRVSARRSETRSMCWRRSVCLYSEPSERESKSAPVLSPALTKQARAYNPASPIPRLKGHSGTLAQASALSFDPSSSNVPIHAAGRMRRELEVALPCGDRRNLAVSRPKETPSALGLVRAGASDARPWSSLLPHATYSVRTWLSASW